MLLSGFAGVCAFTLLVSVAAGQVLVGGTFIQRWSEEFGPCFDASSCVNGLRNATWSFEEGDGSKYGPYLTGWGNNEAQCYTKRKTNAKVVPTADGARGVLVITAQFHEDGMTCNNPGAPISKRYWSSARLITRGKTAFAYESTPMKIEARVKVPNELGAWPAFWLLPNTDRTDCLACGDFGNGWCSSGEVDILEARNRDGMFRSTIHYGGLPDQPWLDCHQASGDFNASRSIRHWNRVSVVMGNESISFFVNDTLVHTVNQTQWYTGGANKTENPDAPFNRPFYLLLNLAVGGNFPASGTGGNMITDTRRAPYNFMIDWIRVYTWRPSRRSRRSV